MTGREIMPPNIKKNILKNRRLACKRSLQRGFSQGAIGMVAVMSKYSYTSTSIESQNAGKYSTLKTSLHGCGGNNWSETSRINRSFFAFSKDPEKDLLYAIFWIHRCIYIFIRAKALNYRAWSGMVKNRYQRSIHGLVLYLDIKEIYRLIWNVWVSMFICECHPEHSMGQKAFLAHLAIPQACHS